METNLPMLDILMKLGTSPRGSDTRAVWIDGGIHAREWIAPATATFLIDKLVSVFKNEDNSTCNLKAIQESCHTVMMKGV